MKTPEPEQLMTRDRLAGLLKKHPVTITKWATLEGMPVSSGGGPGRQALFSPAACVEWLLARAEAKHAGDEGLNPQRERALRDHHQGRLAEQLHRRREGDLLEREDVRRTWSNIVLAVRARLLRMPTALADGLAHAATPAEAQRILDAEIRDALAELSHGTPPADTTTPSGPELKRKGRKP